jgi:hypothetical protein
VTEYEALLKALAGVEYIAVGGFAATMHGSARFTNDLDIVYRRTAENIAKLTAALRPYSPYLRGAPPGLPFSWDERTLKNGLNFTLDTSLGWIDVLGEIVGGGKYEALLPASQVFRLFDVDVRCLSLRRLIEVKRAAGRPKDYESVAELELLLREEQSPRHTAPSSDARQRIQEAVERSTICVVSVAAVAAEVHAGLRPELDKNFEDVSFVELADPQPQASLGAGVTAVVLFLGKAFVGGAAGAAGKQAYEALTRSAPAVWKFFFGEHPTTQVNEITPAGIRATRFSRGFSVAARTRHGGIVELHFPHQITADDFRRAQLLFVRLVRRHHAADEEDELSAASDAVAIASRLNRPRAQRRDVLTYDAEKQRLELVYAGAGGPAAVPIEIPPDDLET